MLRNFRSGFEWLVGTRKGLRWAIVTRRHSINLTHCQLYLTTHAFAKSFKGYARGLTRFTNRRFLFITIQSSWIYLTLTIAKTVQTVWWKVTRRWRSNIQAKCRNRMLGIVTLMLIDSNRLYEECINNYINGDLFIKTMVAHGSKPIF